MPAHRSMYCCLPCLFIGLWLLVSCSTKKSGEEAVMLSPAERKEKITGLVRALVGDAVNGNGSTSDTLLQLKQPLISSILYGKNGDELLWSDGESWRPAGDSLFDLIQRSKYYGLFPEDYHAQKLQAIRRRFEDSTVSERTRKDPLSWAQADLLLTDAFVQLIKDIKIGRLPHDSITLNKDSLSNDFYWEQMNVLRQNGSLSGIIALLEPGHRGYQLLKKGIRKFLDSADFRAYTVVPRSKDSFLFRTALQQRLFEGGYIAFDSARADSLQLAEAVKRFQKDKGLTVDGRAGEGTIRMLNLSDREKFIRIAISLDKYKKLPPRMPVKYIWVNASSNYLDVIENGEVVFSSKVICGKPHTRTPLLNSAVSVLITYPQWVPPPSIVAKEILPAVKKNPAYLARKGFSLLDKEGNEVDPFSVDWTKYGKSIPYRIVQGSGDANALGILKFHFDNKYSVYLHDTNQRYLFANAMRSLSHGCVRVQDWEKLAVYILRNDSLRNSGRYNQVDSMRTWLKNKEKHHITVRNRMPVYIRYMTCEGKNGGVVFYDDVYGEDRYLKEKYFALK